MRRRKNLQDEAKRLESHVCGWMTDLGPQINVVGDCRNTVAAAARVQLGTFRSSSWLMLIPLHIVIPGLIPAACSVHLLSWYGRAPQLAHHIWFLMRLKRALSP